MERHRTQKEAMHIVVFYKEKNKETASKKKCIYYDKNYGKCTCPNRVKIVCKGTTWCDLYKEVNI